MRAAKDVGDEFTATEIKIALDRSYTMIEGMKKNGLKLNAPLTNPANLPGDGTVTSNPQIKDEEEIIDFMNYGVRNNG